ncbi:MAG: YhbY family RNA-binding protein [Gammaproteobacteria bacterium]|nr:YhbY family RNA-binding protein [Gammaproteobacteria bacterium]
MSLSKSSIKNLRAQGHRLKLKPVVIVGQHGLSENIHHEIDTALSHHELLKIRIPGQEKQHKQAMINTICNHHQATLIQSIGNVIVLYRLNRKNNRFAKFIDHS